MTRFAFLFVLIGAALRAEDLTPDELSKLLEKKEGVFFLDVRNPDEIEKNGTVPGYVNIPIDQLEKRLSEVPKDKVIVPFCARGVRAGKAADLLKKNGYKVAGSCGLTAFKEKYPEKVIYPKK